MKKIIYTLALVGGVLGFDEICSIWKMSSLSGYNKYITSNSNRHRFHFDVEYTIYDAFGMKYKKNPELTIHNEKGNKVVTLNDYLNQTYPDIVNVKYSNCLSYPDEFVTTLRENIVTHLEPYSTIANITDINSQFAYTNLRYTNLSKYTRNAIGCFTDAACVTKYCFIRGKSYMYDPNTQLCYYPLTKQTDESKENNLFVNDCCNLI